MHTMVTFAGRLLACLFVPAPLPVLALAVPVAVQRFLAAAALLPVPAEPCEGACALLVPTRSTRDVFAGTGVHHGDRQEHCIVLSAYPNQSYFHVKLLDGLLAHTGTSDTSDTLR